MYNFELTIGKDVFIYIPIHIYIYKLTPPDQLDGTRSIFQWSLTGLNLEFSFFKTSCHTKVEKLSLPNYLPIAEGRIVGFIPFSRLSVPCEMQTASSRI